MKLHCSLFVVLVLALTFASVLCKHHHHHHHHRHHRHHKTTVDVDQTMNFLDNENDDMISFIESKPADSEVASSVVPSKDADKPAADKPAADKPAADKPAADKPADKPAADSKPSSNDALSKPDGKVVQANVEKKPSEVEKAADKIVNKETQELTQTRQDKNVAERNEKTEKKVQQETNKIMNEIKTIQTELPPPVAPAASKASDNKQQQPANAEAKKIEQQLKQEEKARAAAQANQDKQKQQLLSKNHHLPEALFPGQSEPTRLSDAQVDEVARLVLRGARRSRCQKKGEYCDLSVTDCKSGNCSKRKRGDNTPNGSADGAESSSSSSSSSSSDAHHGKHAWGYEKKGGDWTGKCKSGRAQSPINIDTKAQMGKCAATTFDYVPVEGKWKNNGHTIQIDGPFGSMTIGEKRYVAKQLHLHAPSEHTFDNKHYDAELHIVHQLEGATGMNDLAVLGILLSAPTITKAHPFFTQLKLDSKHIPMKEGEKSNKVSVDVNLIKEVNSSHVYCYQGSLTTPSCDETVTWRVLAESMFISEEQLKVLLDLWPKNHSFAKGRGNSREVQPTNAREVTVWRRHSLSGNATAGGAAAESSFAKSLHKLVGSSASKEGSNASNSSSGSNSTSVAFF